MSNLLISILMPAYNAEKYIKRAIDSILLQTYQNWELLICDDSSQDSTGLIAREFEDSRINVYQNEVNQGYLKTVNFLFQKAAGEYVTFLDADDWLQSEKLGRQIEQFTINPKLGICGTWAQYYNERGTEKTNAKCPATDDDQIKLKALDSNQFCGASIMIHRRVLNTVGVYREYFNKIGNEDYDWSSRIVEKFEAKNIPELLYNVRQTNNSITRVVRDQRQLISAEIVRVLIKQRRTGKDYIELNNVTELKVLEYRLLIPYRTDPSLQYRMSADMSWYNGNRDIYLKSCYKALVKSPLKLINWKYFIHAIARACLLCLL